MLQLQVDHDRRTASLSSENTNPQKVLLERTEAQGDTTSRMTDPNVAPCICNPPVEERYRKMPATAWQPNLQTWREWKFLEALDNEV